MFYRIIKYWIRLTLLLYCRKIRFSNRALLKNKGPLLLALNHPNSFFDAILIGSHFNQPVYFLARGDAFQNPLIRKVLLALKMIPIYRLREGRENLALNDATFDRCREIFLQNGIVLIFAEGLCLHQWQLRPLKKGAARIALDAWTQPSIANKFSVQPVSLNYDSFSRFGKRVIIHFGEPLSKTDISQGVSEGERINEFNQILSAKMAEGMIEEKDSPGLASFLISHHDAFPGPGDQLIHRLKTKQQSILSQFPFLPTNQKRILISNDASKKRRRMIVLLLFTPFACLGWLLNAALYFPLRNFVNRKTSGTVFYDSVLFGALMFTYPLYWFLLNLAGFPFISNIYVRLILIAMPLFAWALLMWKDAVRRT